jgi:hypothetical protein
MFLILLLLLFILFLHHHILLFIKKKSQNVPAVFASVFCVARAYITL